VDDQDVYCRFGLKWSITEKDFVIDSSGCPVIIKYGNVRKYWLFIVEKHCPYLPIGVQIQQYLACVDMYSFLYFESKLIDSPNLVQLFIMITTRKYVTDFGSKKSRSQLKMGKSDVDLWTQYQQWLCMD